MDLTARENIYLNGTVLGFSPKYLDEKFDEIVEFSELQNFLDVPLKNYSSGMVARIAHGRVADGHARHIGDLIQRPGRQAADANPIIRNSLTVHGSFPPVLRFSPAEPPARRRPVR